MQIIINGNHEVLTWCIVGSFNGGIDCVIPDSVLNDNPLSYKYVDGEFVKNPDYKPPESPLPKVDLEQLALDHEYRLSMLEIGI